MTFSDLINFLQLNSINLLALFWFLSCYRGYFYYTAVKSRSHHTLGYAMHQHRREWIRAAVSRDNRIADMSVIANLERNVAFFASTTLLILAGLVTVLGSSERVIMILEDVPFSDPVHRGEWEVKILLLLCMFVYAFFKFTWSLRQYGFVGVLLGGAKVTATTDDANYSAVIENIAQMASKAGGSFNNGLRTYYFSIAVLGWFVNAWIFMFLSAMIVVVLYRREFRSGTLRSLLKIMPSEQR